MLGVAELSPPQKKSQRPWDGARPPSARWQQQHRPQILLASRHQNWDLPRPRHLQVAKTHRLCTPPTPLGGFWFSFCPLLPRIW